MESAIIVTYRCNARCDMCHTWKYPTKPSEEFSPKVLESLPGNQSKINITGGEPTLRKDLVDIVDILYSKTNRLEIISNGSMPDSILKIADKSLSILESLFTAISSFLLFRISINKLDYLNANIFVLLISIPDVPRVH